MNVRGELNMQNNTIITGSIFTLFLITTLITTMPFAEADPNSNQPTSEIIPINDEIGIEKTTLMFHAAGDNTLPWGFVEGKISNHVTDYPVIIQIYDEVGEAFHFAQTQVDEDGTYEYKFRVRNVDNGQVVNIFEGDYFVKIFKVVYLESTTGQV